EESAVQPEMPPQGSVPQWHTAQESTEQGEHAEDADLGERVHLIGGGAHHQTGADATGASAPSFSGGGVAGFLMARADLLTPPVLRAALPGDPAPIVRDAAGDASYSPDSQLSPRPWPVLVSARVPPRRCRGGACSP